MIRTHLLAVVACVSALGLPPKVAAAAPRERISINAGWRFIKGDPAGHAGALLYDVRPTVTQSADGKSADAEPEAAVKATASSQAVLKPWILPTGNSFIKDPSRRFTRPQDDPGDPLACVQLHFDDSAWHRVDLPHDWAIEGPFNSSGKGVGGGMGRLPSPGVGWYRKKLDSPASDAGRSIFLDIDGAMSYAAVWCNGHLVGGWPYGYASWRVDLTPYIVPGGENQLAIRLDNPPDSSRWYPGGGIYRNVWLTRTSPVHVAHWGSHITTGQLSAEFAVVEAHTSVENSSNSAATVKLTTEIYAAGNDGKRSGDPLASSDSADVTIAAGETQTKLSASKLPEPKLWHIGHPNLYIAVTKLSQDGKPIDEYETTFGIRILTFTPDHGFLLNGERVPIRGINLHHDLGALGAAFNTRAAERQLEMLREMGCNAIRTAHNPPAPELLELTDRMGFLVVDEIFDAWERKKPPLDFHLIFPDWHEQDLRAMVRRDRNHPSVIMWSIGNEVGEQYTGKEGAAVAQRLHQIVKEEDPTRPTTTAMNFAKADMPLPAEVDVIGLNYQGEGIRDTPAHAGLKGIRTPPQYPSFHERFPDKLIFSSETAAAVSTRGEYLFPVHDGVSAPVKDGSGGDAKTRSVSAYELHAADFGSSADKVFAALDKHPYVAGEFVWSGFDYLGEPTPYYSSRSSYFGILDLAGFKKDRFYLYQSRWRPEHPVAHILPHWTWPERVGQVTPVHVFTSGDEAELWLNGKSLGRKKKGDYEYRLRWDDVTHEPGELKVVAWKQGKKWATSVVRTADSPARLAATPDRSDIRADGRDLVFVTVCVTDKQGLTCPRAKDRITFTIEGPGEIVATDNGDPTDLQPFPSHQRNAFNALCLAIVRAKRGEAGTITLRAESGSLQGAFVSLNSVTGK